MKIPKYQAVILDLDQTLTTDMPSWLQFTRMLGADHRKHFRIYERFKVGELSYPDAKNELLDLWRATGRLERRSIERIFKRVDLRKGAAEAVAYLQQKYRVCIISGAIDVFVEEVSEKLGIKEYYAATRFLFDDEGILKDFDYTLSRGEEKIGFFEDFCKKYYLQPGECAAIGDGDSDQPIFEAVGMPVLFVAEEIGKELQKKYKRQIKHWSEIKKYL